MEQRQNYLIFISSLAYGGAEKQAIIDANMLAEGNDVWLVSMAGGPQEKHVSAKVRYRQIEKRGYLGTALRLHKIIVENRIDTIQASLFASMIISAIAALFGKVRVIWHFHSHEYDAPFYSKAAFMIFSRIAAVKKITFVNRELLEFLAKRFVLPKSKLALLYNSSGIEPGQRTALKNKGRIIIGFVGRLASLKRVHLLVSLAESLRKKGFGDFEIWIVGDGEEYHRLQKEIESKSLAAWVKIWGFQENTETYYKRFDLFVSPSSEECLSIALIDAGICGIPAIAFDVGGNSEIVLHEKSGYIVSTMDDLLAKTIMLLHDEDLRLRLGAAARDHCEKMFSQKARKENLLALTKNVV